MGTEHAPGVGSVPPARVPRPGGPAQRYFGDSRCLLVAPELLLLQVAHPVVGTGVDQHSAYRSSPWPRLWHTMLSLSTMVYGGRSAAVAEAARLRELHTAITGLDAEGRRYRALDPEPWHWVHATLVQGAVDAHRLYGTPLPDPLTEAYYREMRDLGRIWGMTDQQLPPDWPAFRAYYDTMVEQRLAANPAVGALLEMFRHPARPAVWWLPPPLWRPVADVLGRGILLVTTGALPPVLRTRFGLDWSPRRARALRRFAAVVRVAFALTPPPLRTALPRMLARRHTRHPPA